MFIMLRQFLDLCKGDPRIEVISDYDGELLFRGEIFDLEDDSLLDSILEGWVLTKDSIRLAVTVEADV